MRYSPCCAPRLKIRIGSAPKDLTISQTTCLSAKQCDPWQHLSILNRIPMQAPARRGPSLAGDIQSRSMHGKTASGISAASAYLVLLNDWRSLVRRNKSPDTLASQPASQESSRCSAVVVQMPVVRSLCSLRPPRQWKDLRRTGPQRGVVRLSCLCEHIPVSSFRMNFESWHSLIIRRSLPPKDPSRRGPFSLTVASRQLSYTTILASTIFHTYTSTALRTPLVDHACEIDGDLHPNHADNVRYV